MPGSSAQTYTRPPVAPIYTEGNTASEATFMPKCFMAAMARAPAMDAPMATSAATFSLTDHSEYTSLYMERFCKISVLGVPG